MNQAGVLLQIVAMAGVGGTRPPEEAMSTPAAMIGRLDMHRASHGAEVAALVKIGATLWNISSRPDGVHAPIGGPSFLRQ